MVMMAIIIIIIMRLKSLKVVPQVFRKH
jgi:hypothetical protein